MLERWQREVIADIINHELRPAARNGMLDYRDSEGLAIRLQQQLNLPWEEATAVASKILREVL